MGAKKTTLRDIANKTGFSANTVSLALRDSEKLTPATRKVIREAAAELNYLPNLVAQSLVSSHSGTIGLVLTDFMNPTLTEVAQAVGDALYDRGYSTLFAMSNNLVDREIEAINTFRSRQADGLLVFPVHHRDLEALTRLRSVGYPVVSLVDDPTCGIDSFSLDEPAGAYLATRHLLELGHQEIALLDAVSGLGNTGKRDGYRRALVDFGLAGRTELEQPVDGHGMAEDFAAFAELWKGGVRPTAVFATSDSLALGVERWCSDFGISVPNQLSIVGFDNTEQAKMANIPLTTVNFPVRRISRAAVEYLLSLVAEKEGLPPPKRQLFAPELIVRSSSTPPR